MEATDFFLTIAKIYHKKTNKKETNTFFYVLYIQVMMFGTTSLMAKHLYLFVFLDH